MILGGFGLWLGSVDVCIGYPCENDPGPAKVIGAPSWSPDGAALVFHVKVGLESEIYRVDADGGDLEQLTSEGGNTRSPAWSPDGRRIAFSRSRTDFTSFGLYVANADGSGPTPLHVGAAADPTWSPDGKRIGFVTGGLAGVGRLATVAANGRSRRRLAQRRAENPAWSPSGALIAFSRGVNAFGDPDGSVSVVRADGRGRRRLVIRKASDPTWSPDGRLLAVSSVSRGGIFVVPIAGGRPRRLPIKLPGKLRGVLDLAWSPAGRRIAFVTRQGLYVAEIDGSGVRLVAGVEDAQT